MNTTTAGGKSLFPVEREHNTIIIFFLLSASFLLAFVNVYRACSGLQACASPQTRIYKIFLVLGSSLWAIHISFSFTWAISDWILKDFQWYQAIVRVCSIATLRMGLTSIIALFYSLVIIMRFRMLHKVVDYPMMWDRIVLAFTVVMFALDPVIFVPYVWFVCGLEMDYKCVLELRGIRYFTIAQFLWYFCLEIIGGLTMLYIVKYNISSAPLKLASVTGKQTQSQIVHSELLRKKIMMFLCAWICSSMMSVVSHVCNMFTMNQIFPFGSLTFFCLTVQFFFCERFFLVVAYILQLRQVPDESYLGSAASTFSGSIF